MSAGIDASGGTRRRGGAVVNPATDGRVLRGTLPGTGRANTPIEAWAALYRAFMACSKSLAEVHREGRHSMRYSAAAEIVGSEGWREIRETLRDPTPIRLYRWKNHKAERAHKALAGGHTYLADALAKLPAPDPWLPGEPYSLPPPAVDVRAAVVDLMAFRARRAEEARP